MQHRYKVNRRKIIVIKGPLEVLINRVRTTWQLICEHPGTIETPEARGRDRMRRVAISAAAMAGAIGLATLVSLISIPLTVKYLGPERYGVWLTISSLLTWLAITDMGFGGSALINVLAEARGRDDINAARAFVSTALFGLCGIAFTLLLIFFVSFSYVPWDAVFNTNGVIDPTELKITVGLAFIIFTLMFPINLVNGVYSSYQEGYIGSIWTMVANLVSLISLIVVVHFKGGLPLLVLALSGSRLIVLLMSGGYLFWVRHSEIRPSTSAFSFKCFKRLSNLGWKYLLQQLAGIGMFQSQPIMISQSLGPQQVGVFAVTVRILELPLTFVRLFSYPLVAAYGEAKARNEWPWIWETVRRSIFGSISAALIFVVPLAIIAKPLIDWWVDSTLVPPTSLVVILSCYVLLNATITPIAAFFTGIEWISAQAIIGIINALVTVGLAFILLPLMKIPGIGLAILVGILFNVLGQGFLIWRIYSRSHRKLGMNEKTNTPI